MARTTKTKTTTDPSKTTKTGRKPHSGSFKPGNKKASKKALTESNRDRTNNKAMEVVTTKKVDKALVDRFLVLNSHLSVDQLIEKLNRTTDPISVLEGMLIKAMIVAYRKGDVHTINFLLDRMIGKIPNRVAISLDNELEGLSDEELIQRKHQYANDLDKEIKFLKQYNPRVRDQLENANTIIESGSKT